MISRNKPEGYYSLQEIAEITGLKLDFIEKHHKEMLGSISWYNKRYYSKESLNFFKKLQQEYYTLIEACHVLGLTEYLTKKRCAEAVEKGITVGGVLYLPKVIIDEIAEATSTYMDTLYTAKEAAQIMGDSIKRLSLIYTEEKILHNGNVYYEKKFIDSEFKDGGKRLERKQGGRKKREIDEPEREHYTIQEMNLKFGIEYMLISERDKYRAVTTGKNTLVWEYPKDVIDENVQQIKAALPPIKKEDYYNLKEIADKLNRNPSSLSTKTQVFFEGIDLGKTRMFPKSKVDAYIEKFKDTIPLQEIAAETHTKYKIGVRRLTTLLKKNGVEILLDARTNVYYIRTSKLEQIDELCREENMELTPYERYQRNKKHCIPQASIPNTVEVLDEFVKKRFSQNPKTQDTIRIASCYLYEFLATHLLEELSEVGQEQINLYLQQMFADTSINQGVILEFARFINYIHKKKIYAIDYNKLAALSQKNRQTKESVQNEPYTESEFLKLWNLVYNKIFEPEYLERVVDNRNTAMSCLYIAMHFVTIWRQQDIMNIPYPHIERLGFSTGEDFIGWLKQGNEFTENMGIVMCKDMQLQINALGVKASKNDKTLVFEFGMLQAKGLGFLLCLCEAYRRSEQKQREGQLGRTSHKNLIADIVRKRVLYYDEVLKKELDAALNGQRFSNRRANKSYGNYILNKSEEGKFGIGYFIVSVLRSHTLDENLVASVTQKYLNRNVNGSIDDISLALFDRGTFGFAKYQLLSIIDSSFPILDFKEQTKLIKELAVKNSDIEKVCKAIQQRSHAINALITKSVKSPEDAIKVLYEIVYGPNCAGHEYTKCLLRAILSAEIMLGDDLERKFACLRDNGTSCIGCPMLIQETMFMIELNARVIGTLERALNAESEFDRNMYAELIYDGYMPLLNEFAQELGYSRLEQFVDLDKIELLHEKIKILEDNRVEVSNNKGGLQS